MLRDHALNPGPHQELPPSLYAADRPTNRSYPPLTEGQRTAIAIVGGGITGLSTAISVAQKAVDCIVLEANEPGWGASGRNGGHINPGFKLDPAEIEAQFGEERGRQMVDFGYGAADYVFEIVKRYKIDCEIVRGGGYRAAINARNERRVRSLVDQCLSRGMPVEYHDSDTIAQATGTRRYVAAMLDKRAGQLNPLKYVRGLAAAALAAGARLYGNSPVQAMERDGGKWRLRTPQGQLIADRVLIATNGYTGPLIPGLSRSIIPVFSSIVATEPLPERLSSRLLANGQVLYEAGRVTTYYRVDGMKRLIFGGRGSMKDAAGASSFPDLIAYAQRLWPDTRNVAWEYGWNGRIAMTSDHYPHVHDPEDGRLICLGYNGRGIAVATAIGVQLAAALVGEPCARLAFPVVPIREITMQPWWRLGAVPVIFWSHLADRLGI